MVIHLFYCDANEFNSILSDQILTVKYRKILYHENRFIIIFELVFVNPNNNTNLAMLKTYFQGRPNLKTIVCITDKIEGL